MRFLGVFWIVFSIFSDFSMLISPQLFIVVGLILWGSYTTLPPPQIPVSDANRTCTSTVGRERLFG